MKTPLSIILLVIAFSLNFFSIFSHSNPWGEILVSIILVVSIYFAASAMRQKNNVALESGPIRFFGLLICSFIIIINICLVFSYLGKWVVVFFVG